MAEPIRILFVCLGNIVRSPLAENLFRHLAAESGVEGKYEVDSAGTSSYHVGDAPDSRMREVAAGMGIKMTGASRQFVAEDFERFDLIIAMDASNQQNILQLARLNSGNAKVHMMREWDPQANPTDGVPDPWYGGIDGFHDAFAIVARSSQGLLSALEAGDIGS